MAVPKELQGHSSSEMLGKAAPFVVAEMVLAACTPQTETPVPSDIFTSEVAGQAASKWSEFSHKDSVTNTVTNFTSTENPKFVASSDGSLLTMRLEKDGVEVPNQQWALGTEQVTDGTAIFTLPLLVSYDTATHKTASYALLYDTVASTENSQTYRKASLSSDGKIQETTGLIVMNTVDGKMSLSEVNLDGVYTFVPLLKGELPTQTPQEIGDWLVQAISRATPVSAESGNPQVPVITPTKEVVPESTPTTEIAEPTVPNGLRPENAATQVVENGTWVVKNADGNVTATWNKETKTWVYSAENIHTQYDIVGFEGQDQQFLNELLNKPLPPEDPNTSYILPNENGEVRYGIYATMQVDTNSVRFGDYSLTYESLLARLRGAFDINGVLNVVYELPRTRDDSLIIVQQPDEFFNIRATTSSQILEHPGSCPECTSHLSVPENTTTADYISSFAGRQVKITMLHNYPDGLCQTVSAYCEMARRSAQFYEFLVNPNAPLPTYPYGVTQDQSWFNRTGLILFIPNN